MVRAKLGRPCKRGGGHREISFIWGCYLITIKGSSTDAKDPRTNWFWKSMMTHNQKEPKQLKQEDLSVNLIFFLESKDKVCLVSKHRRHHAEYKKNLNRSETETNQNKYIVLQWRNNSWEPRNGDKEGLWLWSPTILALL